MESNGGNAIGGGGSLAISSESSDASSPALIQVSGQPVQVQSVIHTASGQTFIPVSVASDGDITDEDAERKRRELLTRRPSYRKIFNDLSGTDHPGVITVQTKVEQDDSNGSNSSGGEDSPYAGASVNAGALQLGGDAGGLQTLTMTNDSVKGGNAQAATIVQYTQEPGGGQFFIPVSAISSGNVQYQIASNSLPQGVVMATSGSSMGSPSHVPEEASRKRELRLLKNREAARECRRKKKEYVKCLENRVAVLENQNKTLIEELKSLKELYCQKEAQS